MGEGPLPGRPDLDENGVRGLPGAGLTGTLLEKFEKSSGELIA